MIRTLLHLVLKIECPAETICRNIQSLNLNQNKSTLINLKFHFQGFHIWKSKCKSIKSKPILKMKAGNCILFPDNRKMHCSCSRLNIKNIYPGLVTR